MFEVLKFILLPVVPRNLILGTSSSFSRKFSPAKITCYTVREICMYTSLFRVRVRVRILIENKLATFLIYFQLYGISCFRFAVRSLNTHLELTCSFSSQHWLIRWQVSYHASAILVSGSPTIVQLVFLLE